VRISSTEQYMGCELALYDVMHHHLDILCGGGDECNCSHRDDSTVSRGHRVGPNPR